MGNPAKVYEVLRDLKIEYMKHEHPPVFTVEDTLQYYEDIEGVKCKNLFLRNKKGDQHYLVVVEDSKPINIKELSQKLGTSVLSFGSAERLDKYLGLVPGEVSPFGLINDVEKHVKVILDKDFLRAEKINFHPNVNTATLTLTYEDFKKFLDWTGHKIQYETL